MYRIK